MENKLLATAAVGISCGVALGWLLRSFCVKSIARVSALSGKLLGPADTGEYKMVIVVRMDLKMSKGKIAAQCCHAAVHAVQMTAVTQPELLDQWESCGQPKVVVKVDDERLLLELYDKVVAKGLSASLIRDAGRTQIAPHSRTVLGVGPGPSDLVDEVTGHLRLY